MKGIDKSRIIFVEGETECSLFQKLKARGTLHAKKVVKKNFWCDDIKKYSISIPNKSDLIVVFDTDAKHAPDRFIANINYLTSRKHSVFLLQQTSNFEEELAYACSISAKKLIQHFCKSKTSGVNDFKRDFISCNNQVDKLVALGMNKNLWFSRELHRSINCLNKYKSTFSHYFKVDLI